MRIWPEQSLQTVRPCYHAPEKYVLVSVGDPLESSVTNKVRTTRWKTKEVRNVAFNIGEFEEYEFTDPRVPPITLHVAEKMHKSLVLYDRNGRPIPILAQRDMDEMVISDLTNSMSFFQDFYGPATVNQFYATETPYYHGEAYPGVVLLSWLTFQWTDDKGNDDMFRAHEVAHQWWGIGVDFATYRDQWISEGFSEFAGLWYMQIIRLNNELYFEKLDDWREALLDRRKDIGPISLGYRLWRETARTARRCRRARSASVPS